MGELFTLRVAGMARALRIDDLFRAFGVVVECRHAGRRADIISESGQNLEPAVIPPDVEYRIVVKERRGRLDVPVAAQVSHRGAAHVAHPRLVRDGHGHVFVQPRRDCGLHAALAVAFDGEVFAVPFRQALHVFQRTDQTEHHAVEVGGFRVLVFFFVEGVSLQFAVFQVLIILSSVQSNLKR